MRSFPRLVCIGAALFGLASPLSTQAATFLPGVHPFGRFINTGTATVGGPGSSSSETSYEDFDNQTTSFVAFPIPGGPLFYEERYTTPKTLSTVLLDNNARSTVGTVYIATSPGGPFSTVYGTFNNGAFDTMIVDGGVQTGVYGVRVETTSTTGSHLQMAGADFLSIDPGPNVALGQANISSAFASVTDSVTDHDIERAWQSVENTNPNDPGEEFVGFTFATPTALRGIRVSIAGTDASVFGWRNFDVQGKLGGTWITLGRAAMSASENVFWGSLVSDERLWEGVRLFGSTAGGNNPTRAGGGLIVNEIQAFGFLPEPTSMMLLLPAMAMLARKRRA